MSEVKSSVSAKQLVVLVLLLVVAVGGYFGVRKLLHPPTQPGVDVGLAVVEKFLTTVRGGNAGTARDATSIEFKSIEGRESFVRRAKATPILSEPLQFNSIQHVLIREEPRTEYLFQAPKAKMVRVLVGYERGDWKVDRLTL